MIRRYSIHSRFVGRFFIFCCLFLVTGVAAAAGSELSDRQKKEKVLTLYGEYQKEFQNVKEITPEKVRQLMQQGEGLILIDTREDDEMTVSMLPGAISVEQFLGNTSIYKERLAVAYCTIGYRSAVLAAELIDNGLVIHNLKGGVLGWIHAGGPVVRDGREVTQVHVYGKKWDLAPQRYETIKFSLIKQLF